jgi:hypothetical protein
VADFVAPEEFDVNKLFSAMLLTMLVVAAGCAPRVRVIKNPAPSECGFRYYLPKPYLLITPAGKVIEEKTTTTKTISDEFVSIELQYLPDFSEQYSVDVRNRLGTSNVTLELEDGWKLTSVNQELDAKFDENVAAIADLIKAGGGLIPTGPGVSDAVRPPVAPSRLVVRATNIPLGYYESVIGCCNGKKQMYGWRYVGFAPFNSCPTQMCGGAIANCESDPAGPIYGLAFQEGVMVFRPLDELQLLPATDPYHFQLTGVQVADFPQRLTEELQSTLRQMSGDPGLTVKETREGGIAVQLSIAPSEEMEESIYERIRKTTGLTDDQVNVILPPPG